MPLETVGPIVNGFGRSCPAPPPRLIGLEFFDVLLVDPFSDMGQATNSSQATQLWNLVYGFMDKQGLQARCVFFFFGKRGAKA